MSHLAAFGRYLPGRVVGNAEIGARVGKSAEWIESVTGIQERRWAEPGQTEIDMAAAAAGDCLARVGVTAASVGMILVASGSAAAGFPGPAAGVAHRLGLDLTPALDIPVASAGSLAGLALAMQLAPRYGDILVVAAEKMSAVIEGHPLDPNTAILFGDGAGAALVSSTGRWRMREAVLHTDGQFAGDLAWDGAGPLHMNGLSVILQAARKIPAAIEEALGRAGIAPAEVGAFLLHQANLNLLTRVAKALGVGQDRVFMNVQRYGNTSSASLLIAASEWAETNPPAGPVVMAAFGAGFHWGALVAEPAAAGLKSRAG
jgi:3-oxoacyl-[acyl-carrier-protein] synthase-3